MKSILLATSVFLFVVPAVASPPSVSFTIVGEGVNSCGQWTDMRQNYSKNVTPGLAWVFGYVTAADLHRKAGTPDFARGLNGSAAGHWIDNYCDTRPLDNVQTAAEALVNELMTRAK